jgi:hypothetical protein
MTETQARGAAEAEVCALRLRLTDQEALRKPEGDG